MLSAIHDYLNVRQHLKISLLLRYVPHSANKLANINLTKKFSSFMGAVVASSKCEYLKW